MDGMDRLLFNSLLRTMEKEIDSKKIRDMEERLASQHGLGFEDVFYKFDEMRCLLFEFETELKNIEDKILQDCVTADSDDGSIWLTVKNRHLTELILRTFADEGKKQILDTTRQRAESMPRILTLCKMPSTSGYRKLNQLISDGFVIPTGLAETFEGKRAITYRSVIEQLQIIIERNVIVAKIKITKETFLSSKLVQALTETSNGAGALAN